jgi:gliding motility-associated-like protein
MTAVGLEANEQYEVIITDTIGCTITAYAFIEPTEGCLFIATALTPNGDGSNDVWLIGGLEYFPESTVQVYNRWGQILYESQGYSVPWDGTYNGNKVGVADYYFIIDYKVGEEPITGTVTVKY